MEVLNNFKPFLVKGRIEVEVEMPVYFKGEADTEYWDILALATELLEKNLKISGNKHATLRVVETENLDVEEVEHVGTF